MRTLFNSQLRVGLLRSVLVVAGAALLSAASAPPDFSGKWVLDPSRSQDANGDSIELTIQENSGNIDYKRTLRERGGKQEEMSFSCPPVGKSCVLTEDGHKAKVSLWYDGEKLMMAKTGGPDHDAATERKFELSADGKTLTVDFTNYSGSGKAQKLVFTKQ